MDRRVVLAVILVAIVIILTPILFPGVSRPPALDSARVDSGSVVAATTIPTQPLDSRKAEQKQSSTSPSAATRVSVPLAESTPLPVGDSTPIKSNHMTVWYGDAGAEPMRVALSDYRSRDTVRGNVPVSLEAPPRIPLLRYRLRTANGNRLLDSISFSGATRDAHTITYHAQVDGRMVDISYASPTTDSGRYLIHASIQVAGNSTSDTLSIELPPSLVSAESDTVDDIRHLAYGYRTASGDVTSLAFTKLDSGKTKQIAGPLEWVALRNKYFLLAVLTPDSSISGAQFTGAPRVGKLAPRAAGAITIPLKDGRAEFDLYAGPQEFERLRSMGHGLDQVNPYAGFLHGVVQPFATIVTKVLLWMKHVSGLSYGWVIIIFGIAVRLLLWPLNQSSMRTSIRMQRLQPELTELQKKYKSDPKKQQEAMMKLYQSHGMTPFSPMMGCLPMLIPMPILFALYFVFLNTIEFRGVSFLWMHDISAADPYYITPIVMGLSMFLLSWIGMRGTPPTAQTRMMSYMMPVVLTFMFFRFAAGLNLYYAVQNLAALPQQWLLSKERAQVAAIVKPSTGRQPSG